MPPSIKGYWEETLKAFLITKYEVMSAGNLKDIKKSKFLMITDMFLLMRHTDLEMKKQKPMKSYTIYVGGKKIILLSATPLNNYFTDILSLLKLFQRT